MFGQAVVAVNSINLRQKKSYMIELYLGLVKESKFKELKAKALSQILRLDHDDLCLEKVSLMIEKTCGCFEFYIS